MEAPQKAVIIPARNEETNVRQALRSVLSQNCPNLEFIALRHSNLGKMLRKVLQFEK